MAREIYATINGKEYTRTEYQKYIGRLSKEYALLEKVRLMDKLGYSVEKMVSMLRVPEATVRAYLHCGKKPIK